MEPVYPDRIDKSVVSVILFKFVVHHKPISILLWCWKTQFAESSRRNNWLLVVVLVICSHEAWKSVSAFGVLVLST